MNLPAKLTLNEFLDWLRLAGKELTDSRKFIRVAKQLMVSHAKDCFDKGAGPDGVPWKPLAMPRPRTKGADKPLLDTGLLRASLSGGPNHVGRETDTEVAIGTNRAGAALMQHGGKVVPVRSKYLAIPRTVAAQRAGSPRNFPGDLSPVMGKRGGVLLDDKDNVQYVLTKEVNVPARPFLGFGPVLVDRLRKAAEDFLRRAVGLKKE